MASSDGNRGSAPKYESLSDDMDVNAGRIISEGAEVDEVGLDKLDCVKRVASGELTKSEELGHTEFILTYKRFEPVGPACFPA